jgi:hypothetical protein
MSEFWGNNFNVLIQPGIMFEIIPISQMSYIEKINALSRLIILLSIFGFLLTFSIKYLIIGIITLACIYFFYKYNKEGFEVYKEIPLKQFVKEKYYPTNETNPLGNILLTEYSDNPKRKSASPSFNPQVVDDINKKTKNMTKEMNDLDDELFSGLGNSVEFEDSMQRFYATSSTTIPNDQGAFGTYLYGDMPSCKDGDGMQCLKDNYRFINP